MPEKAHVTSVDALEGFRASLVIYVTKARPTVEEVSAEVLRTKVWLENDQRVHWEGQVRRRAKVLEQAQAALSSSRMSSFREASTVELMAVQRAKRALEEAEAKLKLLKYWNREFDSRSGPLVKALEKLHTILANDMLKANAYLAQAVSTLAAYAEMPPPAIPTPPAPEEGRTPAAEETAKKGEPESVGGLGNKTSV